MRRIAGSFKLDLPELDKNALLTATGVWHVGLVAQIPKGNRACGHIPSIAGWRREDWANRGGDVGSRSDPNAGCAGEEKSVCSLYTFKAWTLIQRWPYIHCAGRINTAEFGMHLGQLETGIAGIKGHKFPDLMQRDVPEYERQRMLAVSNRDLALALDSNVLLPVCTLCLALVCGFYSPVVLGAAEGARVFICMRLWIVVCRA